MSSSKLNASLSSMVANAVTTLYDKVIDPSSIQFQQTRKEFDGDITLLVFPLTKWSAKGPEQTANDIGKWLTENCPLVETYNVVKGFLNLLIKTDFYIQNTLVSPPSIIPQGRNLMVEYSSPNTNKPLHLGHIRNNLLGYAMAQILEAAGNVVTKVNLVNDRGIHICKSMLAWKKYGKGETPITSKIKGDHLVGKYYVLFDKKFKEEVSALIEKGFTKEEAEKQAPLMLEVQEMLRKWEMNDEATVSLWKQMNGWVYEGFKVTYELLGVSFDKIYFESDTYLLGKTIVTEGLEKGIFFRKENGSIAIDLSNEGLDEKIVLRSDGTSVYITQDLGTAQQRFEEYKQLQKLIYVVGNEQDYHFKVLKAIFGRLGRPWADELFHLSYGMVDLPSGKMKSREGTVVDADDLIREITEEAEMATKALGKLDNYENQEAKSLYHDIAMGALKYFILRVDPKKKMLFNPAESIDLNGNTGPFIQYTHARICSVCKKVEQIIPLGTELGHYLPDKIEKELLKLIYEYPETVLKAASDLSPAIVANYAYELARSYNHFYHDHVVANADEPLVTKFRYELSKSVASLLGQSLRLLGIVAPQKM
ncbi:MAG: Arginine--tRNA ligase [Bacteroidota bacterium]|jgi:arginyl-tRNA synthetase